MADRGAAYRRITATARVAAGITLAATGAGGAAGDGFSFLSAPAFEEQPAFQAPPPVAPMQAAPSVVMPAPRAMAPQQAVPAPASTTTRRPVTRTVVTGPAFDTPAAPVMISPSLADPQVAEVTDPMAPPAYDRATAARIANVSRALARGETVSADEIRAAAGLPPLAAAVTGFREHMILPPARSSVFNLRLALAMLSQGRQRQDDERVRLAQGTRGDTALALSGGLVTLATLRDELTRTGMQPDAAGPLRVPVVLLEDTVLRLSPGDLIEMSRTDGAFIMSFGRVEIDGATLRTVGEPNPTIQSYRPFLVVAGTGSMTMRATTIEGLGFGDTAKYSGVSVLGHPLRPMDGVTEILDSHMSDVLSLSLTAVNGARVTGNRFADMRSAGVRVSASPRSAVSDNIFHGAGPTNAIRILDRSDDVSLTGNILLAGERAGIVVRRSHAPMVSSNVVWGRDGGGIKLQETTCGVIADNTLLDSRQKGIEIRQSMAATVRNNLIAGNRSAGIWISAQADNAMTEVTANLLSGNGAGLVGATAASVSLVSNDLTAQMPRLADGDLTDASSQLARNLTGDAPMLLTGAGAQTPAILSCGGNEV